MDAETIRKTIDIMAVIGSDTELKWVSRIEGGEYSGPCPFCHGRDRFSVQPNHHNGGRWYCRHCGGNKWHSVIDYVMVRDGIDFKAAMKKLEGGMEIYNKIKLPENDEQEIDKDKWQIAAYKFFDECVEHLWKPEGLKARQYLNSRGLDDETLIKWFIGYNPLEGYGISRDWGLPTGSKMFLPSGIVITCFDKNHGIGNIKYTKIRRDNGEPKYFILRGGSQWLFGGYTFESADIGFLFESELDVLLAWQSGLILGYASLPVSWSLKSEYFEYFRHVNDLIVALDNDKAGETQSDVLCQKSPQYHKANPLPAGKDITEYYQSTGILTDVYCWLYEQLELIPQAKPEQLELISQG